MACSPDGPNGTRCILIAASSGNQSAPATACAGVAWGWGSPARGGDHRRSGGALRLPDVARCDAGQGDEVHYDYPFFARLHDQVKTVWIPIGDVPVDRGPVFVVEGSNRFEDVIADLRGFEVTAGSSRKAAFNRTAIELADERGTHLLTTDFGAGDVLVFGMYTATAASTTTTRHDGCVCPATPVGRLAASASTDGTWERPQRHDRRWLRRAERRQAAHRELARSVVRMSAGAMDDDLAPSRLASLFGLTGRHVIITGGGVGLGSGDQRRGAGVRRAGHADRPRDRGTQCHGARSGRTGNRDRGSPLRRHERARCGGRGRRCHGTRRAGQRARQQCRARSPSTRRRPDRRGLAGGDRRQPHRDVQDVSRGSGVG